MARFFRALVSSTLLAVLCFGAVAAVASTAKAGASCSKLSAISPLNAKTELVCKKVSGKQQWVRVALPLVSTQPKPTTGNTTPTTGSSAAIADQIDQAGATELVAYSGGPGASGAKTDVTSIPLNGNPPAVAKGINIKLWVYDPEHHGSSAGSPGIWVQEPSSGWVFKSMGADGYFLDTWKPGDYPVDTVEPNGNSAKYDRHRYAFHVDANGVLTIAGLLPNAQGFFSLTLDLKPLASPAFQPATPCQLAYQAGGSTALSSGFPRGTQRLANSGTIRALIVPVDFADVPGSGKPAQVFFDMAKGTHDFYLKESEGRVHFDFKIVPTWQRQSFASSAFNLGSYNGGDPDGYYSALVRAEDPVVDYSQFDVVYFLSPPNIPWTSIAYGPAIQKTITTGDGQLHSGAFSGADAYSNTSVVGDGWKWMSHETGHLFGLHDLYTLDTPQTFGSWDLMSMNWTNDFFELTAWNRYISGWLTDSEFSCLPLSSIQSGGNSVKLAPIESSDQTVKAAAVPLSNSLILVVESRKSLGLDRASNKQSSGTIVYTVDMKVQSIKGGWHLIAPTRSTDKAQFTDGALQVGESVTTSGVTVKVVSQDSSGDTVLISKN